MPLRPVAFILVIQIRPGLAVVLVWITPCPPSNYRWRAYLCPLESSAFAFASPSAIEMCPC
jgi:hypothetical protein